RTGASSRRTGSDSVICAAVAIAFAREGADVALSYLPEEEEDAQYVARLIEDAGRPALCLPGDLSDPAFCRDVVRQAADGPGGLAALVNKACRQRAVKDIAALTDAQWD